MKKFAAAAVLAALAVAPAGAQEYPKTRLNVVGSFSNLTAYINHEQPFWTRTLPELTGGQVTAQIKGLNEMGLKGPELLRLMTQGVVMFGAAPLNYFASDNPVNEAIDLAGISPDIETARAVTDAFLPVYARMYGDGANVRILGIGTYPAQVLFCNKPIGGLADIKGMKVRTAGRSQSEFVQALGGTSVTLAFPEVVPALQNGVVDCGITGSLSGYSAKWFEVSTHLYALPISWSQVFYAVNQSAWDRLDANLRALLEKQVAGMVDAIWQDAAEETRLGYACNGGSPECPHEAKGRMAIVEPDEADRELLARITREVTLPKWAARCSAQCVEDFNATIGKVIGMDAPAR